MPLIRKRLAGTDRARTRQRFLQPEGLFHFVDRQILSARPVDLAFVVAILGNLAGERFRRTDEIGRQNLLADGDLPIKLADHGLHFGFGPLEPAETLAVVTARSLPLTSTLPGGSGSMKFQWLSLHSSQRKPSLFVVEQIFAPSV